MALVGEVLGEHASAILHLRAVTALSSARWASLASHWQSVFYPTVLPAIQSDEAFGEVISLDLTRSLGQGQRFATCRIAPPRGGDKQCVINIDTAYLGRSVAELGRH